MVGVCVVILFLVLLLNLYYFLVRKLLFIVEFVGFIVYVVDCLYCLLISVKEE